jgi:hypothetical protein
MNTYRKIIMLILLFILGNNGFTQEISTIHFKEKPKAIIVANVNGSVTLQADDNVNPNLKIEKIHKGSQKVISSIEYVYHNDVLIIYLESPCTELNLDNLSKEGNYLSEPWSVYNWEEKNECTDFLNAAYNLTLQVPHDIPVTLTTINNGDISVSDYEGNLNVNNVNGSIDLENVVNVMSAKTINGDIDINYSSHPETNGIFYTLNGEINVLHQQDVNIDITFKSFMGDFYTDAEDIITLPGGITQEKDSNGTKIKVRDQSRMRIGKGGLVQSFETFNGDAIVRIKPKS